MMRLTVAEIHLILDLIREKYGIGYSDVKEVSRLQTKLSIMLEVAGMMADRDS
jgi:hypothetical protein